MNKTFIKEIYEKYRVPAHVIKHMQKVAQVCGVIANEFETKGQKIDKENLLTAARVHDSLRIIDFRVFEPENFSERYSDEDLSIWYKLREKFKGKRHEDSLAQELKGSHPKIANLVEKHGFFAIDDLKTNEEKILYYADKRVEGDNVVSLEERFKNGRIRNFDKKYDLKIVSLTEQKVFRLEKEIMRVIPELNSLLAAIS